MNTAAEDQAQLDRDFPPLPILRLLSPRRLTTIAQPGQQCRFSAVSWTCFYFLSHIEAKLKCIERYFEYDPF